MEGYTVNGSLSLSLFDAQDSIAAPPAAAPVSIRLARRLDPETSRQAAEKAVAFKSKHEAKIFGYLLDHPEGATYREIASGTNLEPVAVGRRMKGLRERAGVFADGQRDGMQIWRVQRD